MFSSDWASLENSASTQVRTASWSVASRAKVERMVRPSKRRTFRLTVFAWERLEEEEVVVVMVVGGCGEVDDCAFRSFSRSARRISASAFRAALSASMRAFTRASSSASSRFFFRSASRASCCALLADAEEVLGFDAGAGVALCLPFVFDGGVGTAGVGIDGSLVPYKSSSAAVFVWGGDVGATLEPGMGLAPSTFLTELIKSFLLTLLFNCTCSCPL